MKILLYCKQTYSFSILRPVELAARRRGYRTLWYLDPEILAKFPFGHDSEAVSSLRLAKDFLPDAVLVPGNAVPPYLRGVKVQVFHGFAGEKKGHFRIRDYFDLYLTQGPFFTQAFERLAARHGNMRIQETGWPKLDPLFGNTVDTGLLLRELGVPEGRKVILYAPTFSPKLTSAPALLDELEALTDCGPDGAPVEVLIKFHPMMDADVVAAYRRRFAASPHVHLVDEHDLTPFLLAADLMVSDTSSAVYEFLLLDKPVITLNTSTAEPAWTDIRQPSELKDACRKALAAGKPATNAIKREYHPYTDGRSSERMLDAVESYIAAHGVPDSRKVKWWRRFKIRKTLW